MKRLIVYLQAAVFAATSGLSWGQAYPTRPLRLIAPSAPGGPPDVRARWLADKLAPALGQPVIVENKAGAAGMIGTETVAKSAPDGYTLLIAHQGTFAINPHLYARMPYDPIADFAPVTRLVVSPLLLAVHPDLAASSVAELVELAKQRRGQIAFGSPGSGAPPHIAAELFNRSAGIDVLHVPYKSSSAALTDLMAGRVAYGFDSLAIYLPQIRAGRLKALGVTGAQRVPSLPNVPSIGEAGLPGFEYWSWQGLVAPAGTPEPVVTRLNHETVRILATPQAQEWFAAQGGEPRGETPAQFGAFIREEHARLGKLIRETGIRAD